VTANTRCRRLSGESLYQKCYEASVAVRRVVTAVPLLCGMACAPAPVMTPVMTLPQGAGTFARDGARAIQEISNACVDPDLGRPTGTLSIEVSAIGTIGSHRIDTRMLAALGFGVRIEVPNRRGAPTVLAVEASDTKATLFVPRGRSSRVLRSTSFEAILDRIAGVSVDPRALLRIVGGCYLLEPYGYVSAYGERWRRIPGGNGGNVYAYRESVAAPWQMAALFYPGRPLRPQWRLDYQTYQGRYPRTLHLTGEDAHVDVTFTIVILDPRPSLPAAIFSIDVPPSAQEISLADLHPY